MTEKEEVLAKIGEILAEYHGRESDIPLKHEYWKLLNKYRALPPPAR